MRNNWLVQGLLSNWLSSVIVLACGAVIAYFSTRGSPLVMPIVWGLVTTLLVLCIILVLRSLFGATPRNAGFLVRTWLDHSGAATKTIESPEFLFNYRTTLNEKIFFVAQLKTHPQYIHCQTDISFTDEDNKSIEKMPGGLSGVIRLLRLSLALKEIGHSGIVVPIRSIALSKRLLISSDLNEERFINTLYTVEAALNIVLAITAQEHQLLQQVSNTPRSAS